GMKACALAGLVSIVLACSTASIVAMPLANADAATHRARPVDPSIVGFDWWSAGDQARAWYGWSLNNAGDVNSDGYQDIIVAAYRYKTFFPQDGKIFVYYGSPSGPSATPDWTAIGGWNGALLGHS